jgi:hypothetical protein
MFPLSIFIIFSVGTNHISISSSPLSIFLSLCLQLTVSYSTPLTRRIPSSPPPCLLCIAIFPFSVWSWFDWNWRRLWRS